MPGDDRSEKNRDHASTVSRRLLARIRALMAGAGSAQDRLDQIVRVIAGELVAEVCSIYVRRAGDVLELFATEGLRIDAVHRTHLRVGEGIVGDIAAHARALALADAQKHPSFAFRPETGEEAFHSMMGVPVIRDGRVRGVIAVQNRTRRHYSEEEVETLETVAMVMAEMIAGGDLVGADELAPVDGIAVKPLRLEGLSLTGGIGLGQAVLHRSTVRIDRYVAEDLAAERGRLDKAYAEMHGALDNLMKRDALSGDGEHRDIMRSYQMIASDDGWMRKIADAIDGGLTAEAAVEKVQNDLRARMQQISDPYLRERIHDIEDLGDRLLRHLLGEAAVETESLPDDVVLVARNLGPAQLFDYGPERLRALILEEGSPTSHAAIVARALDIPVVAQVSGATGKVQPGDQVIVDGDGGRIYLRPGEDVQQTFAEALSQRSEQMRAYDEIRDEPARSLDGVDFSLLVNAGLMIDMQRLAAVGADGVGLYRTEVPFMVRPKFPGLEEQVKIYAEILESAGERPVVFRTLDVGGDKTLPYWSPGSEENPAIDWHSIRISLDRPAILRRQLRALIRAAAGRPLHVMFPMIAEVQEFIAARAMLDLELERHATKGGEPPSEVHAGCMLEVPALAFQLPALLRHADFISVGSNDLMQFLFASDRGNTRLMGRYDPLSPSVIRFLSRTVHECDIAGRSVSLCGEMAGSPVDAMALIAIGFRRLSMTPSSVGPIKAMIRSLDVGQLKRYMLKLRDIEDRSLREKLRAFAIDHGVAI